MVNKKKITCILLGYVFIILLSNLFMKYIWNHNVTEDILLQIQNRQISGEKITCHLQPPVKRITAKGNFIVFNNFVEAEIQFGCFEFVTMAVQGDYTTLHNLIKLNQRWQGPISLAVYAPGRDFFVVLKWISYLRACTVDGIKDFVTFHLFMENSELPRNWKDVSLYNYYNESYDCSNGFPRGFTYSSYRSLEGLLYYINVGRNIAREAAQTHFVFSNDIELIPTPNFHEQFFAMLKKKRYYLNRVRTFGPYVFSFPVFEIESNETLPENKAELQALYKSGKAAFFHQLICSLCHAIPEGKRWIESNQYESLDIFSKSKRQGIFSLWEPMFVGTRFDPEYDERLTWEGRNDKMTQSYAMCLLRYNFLVMDNAFLTHVPGIKKSAPILSDKIKTLIEENKKLKAKVIKPELEAIYGKNSMCRM